MERAVVNEGFACFACMEAARLARIASGRPNLFDTATEEQLQAIAKDDGAESYREMQIEMGQRRPNGRKW